MCGVEVRERLRGGGTLLEADSNGDDIPTNSQKQTFAAAHVGTYGPNA